MKYLIKLLMPYNKKIKHFIIFICCLLLCFIQQETIANFIKPQLHESFETLSEEEFLSINEDDFVIGCEDAPSEVIEYSSFVCPHCSHNYSQHFKNFKEEYVDTCKVKYVLRNFPTNESSFFAAMLYSCAPKDIKSNVIDLLFTSQAKWAYYRDYVIRLDKLFSSFGYLLDENFYQCVNSTANRNYLQQYIFYSQKKLQLQSTPVIFLNKEKLPLGSTLGQIKNYIN